MTLREGDQIGPYHIVKQLGQGGMATVYKCHHPELDRHVAIKMMHQNFLEDASFVARFQREAQIVAKLEHPHIVPVYDFSQHDGQPYLVMKYIEGITLKQRLRKRVLSLDEILYIMTAIGSALTYAHDRGVLHRDIKPSNVVIDQNNTPYLTDFGLARLAAAGESTMSADMLLGTPHYISPEQASGSKNLDGRADLYSLGVMLYELLIGTVPFTADTPFAIIHDHIYTPPPRPSKLNPEIPPGVEAVLLKAMAKDPGDRYDSADRLVADLKEAVEEARLDELSEARASIAVASLARYREESFAISDGDRTPSLRNEADPSLIAPDRVDQSEGQTAPQPGGRYWRAGGCALFLGASLLAVLILLNAAGNLRQIEALADAASEDTSDAETGVELSELGIRAEELPGLTVYTIPDVTVEEAQALQAANPADPVAYVVLASALWQDARTREGYSAILRGGDFADDTGEYLFHAASAAAAQQIDGAVGYYLMALHETDPETERYNTLRPIAGEYLYDNADVLDDVDLEQLLGVLISSGSEPSPQLIRSLMRSPAARMVIARNNILNAQPLLAAAALNNTDDAQHFSEELDLVRGQLLEKQGRVDRAVFVWNTILDSDSAPTWVKNRAQALLEEQ